MQAVSQVFTKLTAQRIIPIVFKLSLFSLILSISVPGNIVLYLFRHELIFYPTCITPNSRRLRFRVPSRCKSSPCWPCRRSPRCPRGWQLLVLRLIALHFFLLSTSAQLPPINFILILFSHTDFGSHRFVSTWIDFFPGTHFFNFHFPPLLDATTTSLHFPLSSCDVAFLSPHIQEPCAVRYGRLLLTEKGMGWEGGVSQ